VPNILAPGSVRLKPFSLYPEFQSRLDEFAKIGWSYGLEKRNAGRKPDAIAENKMVGTRRLELLTSTVSKAN
jgi:hypothetical protein